MGSFLEVKGLRVRRGGRLVLTLDHLTIEKGEILAVVGPNGAGKTTLLLTLAGLLRPEQGSICLEGREDGYGSLDYRRRLALVMQENLLLSRSVFENVALGLRFRHLPKQEVQRRVEEWLERLKIVHLAQRQAGELSGGEARRVALARAFVLEPELLLLDEPFSALDRPTRQRLQEDLKTILLASGTTTIFTTHSESEVRRLAERKLDLGSSARGRKKMQSEI